MKFKVPVNITEHARFRRHSGSLPTAGRLRQSHPQAITDDFGTSSASTHTQRWKAASGSDPRGDGTERVAAEALPRLEARLAPVASTLLTRAPACNFRKKPTVDPRLSIRKPGLGRPSDLVSIKIRYRRNLETSPQETNGIFSPRCPDKSQHGHPKPFPNW